MKFQFSIRTILIVTAIAAIGISIGKKQYDRWHWANTPIEFQPYSSLEHMPDDRPVLVILSADWDPSGSLEMVRKIHLRSSLKHALHDKQIIPVNVDCTHNTPEYQTVVKKYGFENVPFVLLLQHADGPVVYAGFPQDVDKLRAAVDAL